MSETAESGEPDDWILIELHRFAAARIVGSAVGAERAVPVDQVTNAVESRAILLRWIDPDDRALSRQRKNELKHHWGVHPEASFCGIVTSNGSRTLGLTEGRERDLNATDAQRWAISVGLSSSPLFHQTSRFYS